MAAKKTAKAAKTAQTTEKAQARYAVLKDGTKHRILREDGKYFYCEDTTIRQGSAALLRTEMGEAE